MPRRSSNWLHWTDVESTRNTPRTAKGSIFATSLERSSVQYERILTAPTTDVAMSAFLEWSAPSDSRVSIVARTSVQKDISRGIRTIYCSRNSSDLTYFCTFPLKSFAYLLRSSVTKSLFASIL